MKETKLSKTFLKKVKKFEKKVLTYPERDGIINKSLTQATTEP